MAKLMRSGEYPALHRDAVPGVHDDRGPRSLSATDSPKKASLATRMLSTLMPRSSSNPQISRMASSGRKRMPRGRSPPSQSVADRGRSRRSRSLPDGRDGSRRGGSPVRHRTQLLRDVHQEQVSLPHPFRRPEPCPRQRWRRTEDITGLDIERLGQRQNRAGPRLALPRLDLAIAGERHVGGVRDLLLGQLLGGPKSDEVLRDVGHDGIHPFLIMSSPYNSGCVDDFCQLSYFALRGGARNGSRGVVGKPATPEQEKGRHPGSGRRPSSRRDRGLQRQRSSTGESTS